MGGRGSKSGVGKSLTNSGNSGTMKKETNAERYARNSAAIATTLSKVESGKTTLNHEVGTIVDLDGKVINTTEGEEHSVIPPRELMKGNIFTHNHPGGGNFTKNDIQSFVADDLHELRASTPQGTYFSLKVASDTPNPKIVDDFESATRVRKAINAVAEDYNAGKLSAKEARDINTTFKYQSKLADEFLSNHAKDYGYEYTKGEIKK